MKPFNLEKALAGKLCVTRDGKPAIIMFDRSTVFPKKRFVLGGYLKYDSSEKDWCDELILWTREGHYHPDGVKDSFDIIGMWEEPQHEVTVTFPAPLKEAEDKQIVWYIKNDGVVTGHYYKDTNFCIGMLSSGQFFATAKDAQRFADALKGARR